VGERQHTWAKCGHGDVRDDECGFIVATAGAGCCYGQVVRMRCFDVWKTYHVLGQEVQASSPLLT
jgi:hypothetical protein